MIDKRIDTVRVQYGALMSELAMVSEVVTVVPELAPVVDDVPCPVCGLVCPNELYCVSCGYVHDPVMKKYQTPEQLESESQRQKEFKRAATKRERAEKQKNKQSKHHALMVRVGREYKHQNGKTAEVGDIVRRKKQDGSYDKGSFWYIKTPKGWIRSPFKKRKPTQNQIKRVCQNKKN